MRTSESVSKLYREARAWLAEDWCRVEQRLGDRVNGLRGKQVLVTGGGGFLGFNFLHFFSYLNEQSGAAESIEVVAADNYQRGQPRWMLELVKLDPHITLRRFDITQPWPDGNDRFDFVVHAASIASPVFYRQYPLETLDVNVSGIRQMLELAGRMASESVLYFSSSEIYGDPPAQEIPTKENYRGNVGCIGPRACYDESKRLGETLCHIYAKNRTVPVKIVRPFNNYGPGLRLNDGRVLPDFCRDALADRDIVLRSDGSPTRTFCYVSDALSGYLLALLSDFHGDPFNIGSHGPEISMQDLAEMVLLIGKSTRRVVCKSSPESDYLTDNPARRCPDISKARRMLGFNPTVGLETGLARMLHWYRRFPDLDELLPL
jgi:UDP-glucuronate decarboxylase